MSADLAAEYAELVAATRYDDLPAAVIERAKLALLDALAVTGAGAATPLGAMAEAYAAAHAVPGEGFAAYPRPTRYRDWETAGFVLGVYAFAQNYADTSLYSVAHAGTVVPPAVLLAAQQRRMSGRDALVATVLGYELCEVFARELNGRPPRMALQVKGFRPTSTCGPFGVVAVVGSALGLAPEVVAEGLAIACNHAAGLRGTSGHPLSAIRVQSGTAVRLGLSAIDLARHGLRGAPKAFEGSGGLLDALDAPAGAVERLHARAAAGPRAPWTITDVAVKLHCTPQILATGLDCLLTVARRHDLDAGDVAAVQVRVPAAHWQVSSAQHDVPATLDEAALSWRHCAAVALATRDFVWTRTLADSLGDGALAALARKVTVTSDERLSARFDAGAAPWPAAASVTTRGGAVLSAELDSPIGSDATDAATRAAVERKLALLADDWPVRPDTAALGRFVATLEDCPDVHAGLAATVPGG